MSAILETDGLTKRFGALTAVDGVRFSVRAGERVALIGPNGAGKSTLFELLGGGLTADAGQIRFDGQDVTRWTPMRRAGAGIQRTFQIAAVFRSMTARENVQTALLAAGGKAKPMGRAADALIDEADALLAKLGIPADATRPVSELPYGDVKRLELAMALAGKPSLLLLDEPTAGMAAAERRAIMEQVCAVAEAGRISLLFTEHDMDTVFGFAERVLVLHEGRIIADGPPADVRGDANVRAVYLGADADA